MGITKFYFVAYAEGVRMGRLKDTGYPDKNVEAFIGTLEEAQKEAKKRADRYELNTGLMVTRVIVEAVGKLE